MKQSLLRKMITGYVIVILIPTLSVGWIFYQQMYRNIKNSYAMNQQEVAAQVAANVDVKLAQVQSLYFLLQFNRELIEFLSGDIRSEKEQLNHFIRHIRPLLSYAALGNSIVNSITVYKEDDSLLSFRPEIISLKESERDIRAALQANDNLPLDRGKWYYQIDSSSEISWYYYRKLYDNNFSGKVGLIEVELKGPSILEPFEGIKPGTGGGLYLVDSSGKAVYEQSRNSPHEDIIHGEIAVLSGKEGGYRFFRSEGRDMLATKVPLREFELSAIIITPVENAYGLKSGYRYGMLGIVFLLLLILSFAYYLFSLSVSRRILKLARHMRITPLRIPALYDGKIYTDEIGLLAASFNSMIGRIHELVQSVANAEIKQKEAAFLALQAQIQPHFIFNTLETIRSRAEANGDADIEDMSCTLGQLIRYSISPNRSDATLADEIRNVENYLKIQRIRFGPRLSYNLPDFADVPSVPCPKYILQPLVENSIRHGISNRRRPGIVTVAIQQDEDSYWVRITDNGAGILQDRLNKLRRMLDSGNMEADFNSAGHGIGLLNVHQRIQSYYGFSSGILLESGGDKGAVCMIRICKGGIPS